MKTRRVDVYRKLRLLPPTLDGRTPFRFATVAVAGYEGNSDRGLRRAVAGRPMQRTSPAGYPARLPAPTCWSGDPAWRVGTLVAGYRIEAVVSSGGMGTVYLARHPSLPRRDALKVLDGPQARDSRYRARFMREADLAAGLHHPNIVAVYDRGATADGALWIAMEYVRGTDAEVELRAGRMSPTRAEFIVSGVAMALDHLHRRNMLHRDVKPANILLSPGLPGEGERVVLADFGIARNGNDNHGLTRTGDVITTVAYASPELLQGWPLDSRTDIYSLGCSLFHLLTGHAPYDDRSDLGAVMLAHIHQPAPRVSAWVEGLPAALDDIIATAMAKDPGDRYQTAGEFARAVRATMTAGCSPALPHLPRRSRAQLDPVAHRTCGPAQRLREEPAVPSPPQRAGGATRNRTLGRLGKAAAVIVAIALLLGYLALAMAHRHHSGAQHHSGYVRVTTVEQGGVTAGTTSPEPMPSRFLVG